MAEQTSYLCTLLVDPSVSNVSLGTSQEWFLQVFGLTRLTCKNTFNGTERTYNVNQTSHPWILLLRCPMFKVLGLTDPKAASDSIVAIRIFVQVSQYYAHANYMECLLQENTLQDTLEEQPPNHVFIEYRVVNCNDRTIRKYTRIAQDAFKSKKISSEISENCPSIVSYMMRQKERFQTPHVPLLSNMDQTSLDQSLSFDWKSLSIIHEPTTTKSMLPQTVSLFTTEISFTERSLLLSWYVAYEERQTPFIVSDESLILEQCMLIVYHKDSDLISKWTFMCQELGISQAMITSSILPSEAFTVKVLFVESEMQSSWQDTSLVTAQTQMYMLRLQNDQDYPIDHVNHKTNIARARKLYFSHVRKNISLTDVPLAWCEFGLVCEDLRKLRPSNLVTWNSSWKPHFVIRDGFGDCNVTFNRTTLSSLGFPSLAIGKGPQVVHGINLECPRKWLRSLRTKHIHVAPESALIKWAQVIVPHRPTVDPEKDPEWQNIDKDSIMIRGSHTSVVNAMQATEMIEEHFQTLPKHTIGQFYHNLPGTLRKRGLSLDGHTDMLFEQFQNANEFDCSICQEKYDFSKHAMTYTLCGHSFCLECGNQTFKVLHNANAVGNLTVDCPCCRTSLTIFDLFRVLNDSEYMYKSVSNLEKAIETEKIMIQGAGPLTRRASQKVTQKIVSCENMPSENWHETLDNQITTLFVSHVHPNTYFSWYIQFVKWVASSKKTNKILFFGNSTNQSISALRNLLS